MAAIHGVVISGYSYSLELFSIYLIIRLFRVFIRFSGACSWCFFPGINNAVITSFLHGCTYVKCHQFYSGTRGSVQNKHRVVSPPLLKARCSDKQEGEIMPKVSTLAEKCEDEQPGAECIIRLKSPLPGIYKQLAFKVTPEFHHEFREYAVSHNMTTTELLVNAFGLMRKSGV